MKSFAFMLLTFCLVSCTPTPTAIATFTTTVAPVEQATLPPPLPPTAQPKILYFGYTQSSSDGNHLIDGTGNLPKAAWIDIPLGGTPVWLAAVPDGETSLWAAVLADGRVQAFRVSAEGAEPIAIVPDQLNPSTPPLLLFDGDQLQLLAHAPDSASPFTHPIQVQGEIAFIDPSGNLHVGEVILPVNALPDARLLQDEFGRILLLSGPSEIYSHGVLGDALEATQISLVETHPVTQLVHVFKIPEGRVIEGIAPIWADLTGDGQREIVITLSDATHGAQLAVFDETGALIARSDVIGQGYRWRHQIAVAPFGPHGEMELVTVLTPHLGGIVEFYQLTGDHLRLTAQLGGYTSHVINSRNLDMALAGDFDGDGNLELLTPNQARTELGAIRRDENGATVVWSLPLQGVLSSNLASATSDDGKIWLGAGLDTGMLRVWLSDQ
ncbi:MAG: hypothetical protein HN413_08770 [Chloroflexi bacterium]|jgi:hypothetical protein|nr:hypothetical protein [Chloroflexota bacterium]